MTQGKLWIQEHEKDFYVKRAKQKGYSSRAAFKLLEIYQKHKLFKAGMNVIDLGAAPGGWSQVAKEFIGADGMVIAIDLLPMAVPDGVEFIQGDFNKMEIFNRLQEVVQKKIPNGHIDLVISDMAPNISGMKSVDQPKSLHLVELALGCAQKFLVKHGTFLAKIFQGPGVGALLADLRQHFKHVKLQKPSASRPRSSEVYILAIEFLGYN